MCKRNLRLERIRVLSILSPPHFLLLSHNIVDLTLNLGHHFLPHLLADEGFGSLDSESLQREKLAKKVDDYEARIKTLESDLEHERFHKNDYWIKK